MRRTTKGWMFLVQWKDGSPNWILLKDLKGSNPIEAAEYVVVHKIADEPAFGWWARKNSQEVAEDSVKAWEVEVLAHDGEV